MLPARAVLLCSTLLAACDLYVPIAVPIDGGGGDAENWIEISSSQKPPDQIDVLFVLDDSGSMQPKVEALRLRLPDIINVFTDLAASGMPASYHFGVVTTDLGAPGISCGSNLGAKLQRVGLAKATQPGCEGPVAKNYIEYDQRTLANNLPGTQTLAQTLGCMTAVTDDNATPGGHVGCGFEMPLEASYRALHDAIPENEGFLRPGALLEVIFLSDEDDCSVPSTSDLFSNNPAYGPLNSYRCARYGIVCDGQLLPELPQASFENCAPATSAQGGKLTDLEKYIHFFTEPSSRGGVKANPRDVILAALIPPRGPIGTTDVFGPAACGQGVASCTTLDHACVAASSNTYFGDPSVRLNAVVSKAQNHHIASICDIDYQSALRKIVGLIEPMQRPTCLPRPLANLQRANCIVEERTLVNGVERTSTLPFCGESDGRVACWTAKALPECEPVCSSIDGSYYQTGIVIEPHGQPATKDRITYVSCEMLPEVADPDAACRSPSDLGI